MNKYVFALIAIVSSKLALAQPELTHNDMVIKAQAFVKAKNARQQPTTSVRDIDNFIALLADEFVDEHVRYNFTYTDKAKLRKDMVAKLKDKVVHSQIDIIDIMTGANVVFIKMMESGKIKPAHLDHEVEYEKTNIVSLEFNSDGLIKHIRRHHG
ncbi:nuclear transport factor 2 family protein [Pseudoalteromonas umbrosa]|uniref:nuclear transport factor 2 family protein n=1 Tax=Pseudoalteromonas umbrosa TaxID=3048489 RepID=UPI0024C227BD|nr:nuclear transport factor 2 family protein [Pseudoalteromonas sp. B95]MDK1288211.1 nuclear transport factor 2 family protein [Pseudoalteromonas sp. B95]